MEYAKAELRSFHGKHSSGDRGRPGGKYLRDPCDVEAAQGYAGDESDDRHKDNALGFEPIFNFHDFGRKGNPSRRGRGAEPSAPVSRLFSDVGGH